MKKSPKNKKKSSLPAWMPETLRQAAPGKPGAKKHTKPHTGKPKSGQTTARHGGGGDPHFHRESQKYDNPILSREGLLQFLRDADGPLPL